MNAEFTITRGRARKGSRTVLFGPGGVGKTSLAALADNPVIIDLEGGSMDLDVARVEKCDVPNWETLRHIIQSAALDQFGTVVVDSGTKAEQLAVDYALRTIKNDKGLSVKNLESFGYGKGYSFVYETYMGLLQDLDRHFTAGRNVVIVCHDIAQKVPNPEALEWLRWEPRLQNQSNGNIRAAVKEWADHLAFIGYDVAQGEHNKLIGAGTRTIYLAEMPTFWAKARGIDNNPIVYSEGSKELWERMVKTNE